MKTILTLRRLITPMSALVILSASFGFAEAEDISAAHLAAAQKAIAAIHATDQFDEFLPSTALDLKDELTRKDPNFSKEISETVDQQALAIAKRRGDLEREAARAYANNFTESELNQIASFYESDTGKKLLKLGPATMADVVKAFQVWRQGIAQDLASNVGKALTEKLGSKKEIIKPAAEPAKDNKSTK